MNLKLFVEDIPDSTIGEYAVNNLEVYLNKSLSYHTHRALLIHAILENFCQPWPHDKVDELGDLLEDSLDTLDEVWKQP